MQDDHSLYPDRCTRAVALLCSQTEQAGSSTPSHLARTRLLLVMSSILVSRPWQKMFHLNPTLMTVLSAITK